MINDMILKKETLKMMLSIILVSPKICYFKIISQNLIKNIDRFIIQKNG
jgi:hypothetical protein